jgi:hypothetical protein
MRLTVRLSVVALAVLTTAVNAPPAGSAAGSHAQPGSVSRTTAAHRHRQAVEFAMRILGDSPRTTGETRLRRPPRGLRHANQFPGAENLVTRARYWVVDESAHRTYTSLKSAPVRNLRLTGFGDVGSGGTPRRQAQLSYVRTRLPGAMDYADLFVQIARRGHTRSVVAAFAQVVPHPVRRAGEHIQARRSSVTLTRARSTNGQETHTRTVALDANQSAALSRSINALRVNPPWPCIGGPPLGLATTFTAKVASAGRTWTVTSPGECGVVDVQRGTKQLAALDSDRTLRRLLHHDIRNP